MRDPLGVTVYVSVGSNIEPHVHVPAALRALADTCGPIRVSDVLVTPAIDRPEQPDYWNCVVAVQRDDPQGMDAFENGVLAGIEAQLGRVRTSDRYAARTIDLDVIAIDERIAADEVEQRGFLALGLAQLGGPGPTPPVDDVERAPWQWSHGSRRADR